MTRFTRDEVLQRLTAETARGRSILAVGAGNGLSARCAELGGADLIVVYNSGYYRVNGLPSLVGAIPVGDANEVMLRLGRQSIMPRKRTIPVIAGVYGIDPTRDIDDLLDEVKAIGYSGVINFPTLSRHENSNYRTDLENAGLGFACEVDMMRKARERDLFTLAYVYNPEDASAMAEAGVDVIVGHMGLTIGGDIGSRSAIGMDAAITRLGEIFDTALDADPNLILLSHGGPISTAEDAEYVNVNSKAVGFVAASSFERIPIELALKKTCDEFKSIKIA
ncbi:putative TIM-barrel enzyme [Rhizobium sp. ERR 1071]|uniref:phosphoenolpyruvate hydrolase family protein n=1 Tax=Rhizobium sp. ERR 1071 TaxID=2572677 RepID=UPI00119AB273|nr:phosphoenolpyruvate hydrolase family protein [Rhizobium sp. ERR1071]TWB08697.1 putative TIM-barrel enzyme [Rhizobium sp. ERR1071]